MAEPIDIDVRAEAQRREIDEMKALIADIDRAR